MGGRIEGSVVRQVIARLVVVASAALSPPCASAASVSANLSVSVEVTRNCTINLERGSEAQPRPLCQAGMAAPHASSREARDVQYSGPTEPVSIVRRPGSGAAPDVWVITF